GQGQFPAYPPPEMRINFRVPWHGLDFTRFGILPNRMRAGIPRAEATSGFQMAQEFAAFHATSITVRSASVAAWDSDSSRRYSRTLSIEPARSRRHSSRVRP